MDYESFYQGLRQPEFISGYEILQKIGDGRSLEPLLQMLDDREPAVRAKAAEAVAALSTKDTAARLIEKVKKKAVDLDGYLLALGHMKEKAAIEEVTKVLKSGAPARDRSAAAFSLGLIGDREAIKTLMNVIADDSVPEVRVSSCRSLVRFAAKEALPAVLTAIDRYPDTRAELASQRRNWKEEKSVEALIELLRDPDKDVKDAAWDSLKILTGAALGRNHEDWQSWWELAKIRGGVRF